MTSRPFICSHILYPRSAQIMSGVRAVETMMALRMDVPPARQSRFLHPNLAHVYRQKVERLEQALNDPIASAAAVEALRSLVDAIVVHPGKRRGEVSVELRGDLTAFLHLADDSPAASIQRARTAGPSMENSGSGEVVGSLVAGAGNHLDLLLTG